MAISNAQAMESYTREYDRNRVSFKAHKVMKNFP